MDGTERTSVGRGGAESAGAVRKMVAAYPLWVTVEEAVAVVAMAAAVDLPQAASEGGGGVGPGYSP